MEEKIRHWGIGLILLAIGFSMVMGVIDQYHTLIFTVLGIAGLGWVTLKLSKVIKIGGGRFFR